MEVWNRSTCLEASRQMDMMDVKGMAGMEENNTKSWKGTEGQMTESSGGLTREISPRSFIPGY